MKKIMILGAGIYQVPLIRTARRMGLYTIVVSIPGDYPGFALADKIYELNTRDKEAILAAAEKEQIDGKWDRLLMSPLTIDIRLVSAIY